MLKHYDICLVGFWYGVNYGSILNGYAIYRILKNMGKSVLMLQKPGAREDDPELVDGHNVRFIRAFYDKEDISDLFALADLPKLNGLCDTFCAGSDQIWNYVLSFRENMYLSFAEKGKRIISFATSFGSADDHVPSGAERRIRDYFLKYDKISVREQFGKKLLEQKYGIKSEVVFEPVFCLDRTVYDEISKTSAFAEEDYILAYILNPSEKKIELLERIQRETGKKCVTIADGDTVTWHSPWQKFEGRERFPNLLEEVEICDFLKAFQAASYVITDSFHGTAFSIIFEKRFTALSNASRGAERFTDLLGRLGLLDRLIEHEDGFTMEGQYQQPVDYVKVNSVIQKEKEHTLNWLKEAVNLPMNHVVARLDAKMCTGCSACVNICPHHALTLEPDEHGYYRSSIRHDKCVDCGLCAQICPALHLPEKKNSITPPLYEFITSDEEILQNSSSGGVFPLLANEAFKREGVVAGAAWRNDFAVEHIIIESLEELPRLQKSKYLQSCMGDTYMRIKEKLKEGVFVLFSGCPCQVAGLHAFLGNDYENLLLVDLLCGNAPSTMFFRKYLAEDFPEGVNKYEFRHKVQGWNADCVTTMTTITTGVTLVRRGGKQDNYQRVFHNHTMCPPHCEKCRYQAVPRFGDITIGDFWWVEKKDREIDVAKGVSAVLCNNDKGKDFFFQIPEEKIRVRKEVPLDWLGGNGHAINGSHNWCSPKRDLFYDAIKNMPFSKAVTYALKPNHGEYPQKQLFGYRASDVHFQFDRTVWEEHYVNGVTVLSTRMERPGTGNYCILPLGQCLEAGKRYKFRIRFKLQTDDALLNFHVKDAGSQMYQIIYSHHVTGENRGKWLTMEKEFVTDCGFYDEFMIGAAQIRGKERYIAIEYIGIEKG